MASFAMPFSLFVPMHTKNLATNHKYYSSLLNQKYGQWHRLGETLSSIVDSVFQQMPSQWFSSQYCIHLLRKPVRMTQLEHALVVNK